MNFSPSKFALYCDATRLFCGCNQTFCKSTKKVCGEKETLIIPGHLTTQYINIFR